MQMPENNQISNAIRLERFSIDEISFTRDYSVQDHDEKVQLNPEFSRKISKIEENLYQIVLQVIFSKDHLNHQLPFSVRSVISGEFRLSGIPDDEIKNALERNASSILFPYLRSSVSTIMALAGITPIIIPIMNVNRVFMSDDDSQE